MVSRNGGFLGSQLVIGGLVFFVALLSARGLGEWIFQTFNLESLAPNATVQYVTMVLTGFIIAAVIMVVVVNVILMAVRRARHGTKAVRSEPIGLTNENRSWITSQIAEAEQRMNEQMAVAKSSWDEKTRGLQTTPPAEDVQAPKFNTCLKCGERLPADARFCGNCGSPV